MKRVTSILLVLALLLTSTPFPTFAAQSHWAITDAAVELDGTNAGQVTVNLVSVPGGEVDNIQGQFALTESESTGYFSLTTLTTPVNSGDILNNNVDTGSIFYQANSGYVAEANGVLWTATYSVAAHTPAGEYSIPLSITAIGGEMTEWEHDKNFTLTAKITVTRSAAPENSHKVTFVNHDGAVLQSSNVVKGEAPVYTGTTPVKIVEGYVYTFTGWSDGTTTYGVNEALPTVTGEVTYTAQYSQSKQKYTVTYTGDNINMEPTQHEWGTQVTPAIPTLDGHYFVAWTTTNTNVTIINGTFTMPVGNVTLVGHFAKSADVTIPEGYTRVPYYESPEYLTVSTDTTTVDYYGNNYPWVYENGILHSTNAHVKAESQIAFTAERAGTLTVLYRVSTQQAHGNELLYMYDTPITDSNDELAVNYNDYKNFSGPQVEFTTLTISLKAGQTVFFAKQNIFSGGGGHEDTAYLKDVTFEALPIYTATFNNYDGSQLQTGPVTQGDSPVYIGATPAKPGEDGVSYVFNGWTDGTNTYAPGAALPAATGDVTYTAVFTEVASSYTVTFVNYDGTVLETKEWAAGTTPVYSGATPVKPKTDTMTYDFTGWSPEIVPAAGNATYTAQYVERERTPTFKFWWDAEAYNGNVKLYTSHMVYNPSQTFKGWRTEKLVNGAWVDTWDFETLIPGGSNAWGMNGQTTIQINVMHADIAEGYAFDGIYIDGVKMETDAGWPKQCSGVTVTQVQTNSTDFMVQFNAIPSTSRLDHEIEVRFKKLDSYPVTVDLADGIKNASCTVKSYYDTARTVLREEKTIVLTDGATLNLTEGCELTIEAVTEVGVPAKITTNGKDVNAVNGGYDGATGKTTSVFYSTADNSFVESGNTLAIAPDNGPSFIFTSNIEGAGFIAQTSSNISSLYYGDWSTSPETYYTQDNQYPPVNYVTGTAGQTLNFCVVPWVQNGYRFVGLFDSEGNQVDYVVSSYGTKMYRRFDLTLGDGPQRYEMRFEKAEMVEFTVRFDEDAFTSVTYRPYYYLYKDTTSQLQYSGAWMTLHDGDTITVPKNTVISFKGAMKKNNSGINEYLFKGYYVNDELITPQELSTQNEANIMFGDGDSGSYAKAANCTQLDLLAVKYGYEDVVGYSAEGVTIFQTRQDYPWHTVTVDGETVLTPGNLNMVRTFSYFRIVPEKDGMLVFQYRGNTINGLYTGGSAENKFFYSQTTGDPTAGTNVLVGKQDGWKTFTLKVTAGTEYRFCFKQYSAPAAYPSSLYIKDIAVVPVSTYTINYSSADVNAGLVSATGLAGDTGAAGTAETGNDVTVTASPMDGYRFVKWAEVDSEGNMTTVCTTAAYTFAVLGDRKLVATFAPAFEGDAQAKINDVEFGSLDDALTYATGGDTIILLTDYILTKNLTIPKGITVQIPYSDEVGTTANHLIQPDFYSNDYVTPSVFRTFTVNAGVTLTVQGGLVVDSRLAAKGQNDGTNATPAGPGARLIINRGGSVVVSSGGQMSVWGYVTAPDAATLAGWNESGETAVTIRNGATLREAFQLRDWRGGTNTSNMTANEQKVFPFSQYYVQNVELPLVIEAGGRNLVCTGVFAGGTLAAMPDMPFVCEGGMFALKSGSLKRTYDAATDRTTYAINGDLRINNITLDVLGLVTVSSVDYTLPINSNLTIRVKSGSTVDFDPSQDVCFLPGSELIVEEGATLNVSGKLYFYDSDAWNGKGAVFAGRNLTQVKYVAALNGAPATRNTNTDAKLEIGGTVNVLETGALYTTASGANICGTGETGKIVLKGAAPAAGNTYQSKSNADEANIITVPITAAQLKNADGTYTATAGYVAGTTFCYSDGAWIDHEHDFTGDWVITEEGHAHKCAVEGCEKVDSEVASHVDGKTEGEEIVKDHLCDECGYEMSEHTYEGGRCTICGAADPDFVPTIGNGTTAGTVGENGSVTVTYGATEITVAASASGWVVGENTFTVASTNDVACVVIVKDANGNYSRLTATTTDNIHSFTVDSAFTDECEIIVAVLGDLNGDGMVNGRDAAQMQRIAVGSREATDLDILICDINGDGVINGRDAAQVQRAAIASRIFGWNDGN